MIDDVAEEHLRPVVEQKPYAVAGVALLIPSSLALLLISVGPSLASTTAHNMAASPFVEPPNADVGFLYGFLAGALVITTASLVGDIDCFADAIDATEARIATERYPKHGDNE